MRSTPGYVILFSIIVVMIGVTLGCSSVLTLPKIKQTRSDQTYVVDSDDAIHDAPNLQHVCYPRNPYEGSLWTPANSRSFLFEDNKARNVNDILTVRIMEVSDATRNATTKLSRKGGLKSSIAKLFGSPLDFGMDNIWGRKTGVDTYDERVEQPFKPEIETGSQNSFDGSGTTSRKDSLITTISVKVMQVYPNGNMFIKGKREITINNERQNIFLSGIVRPEDITADNVLVSTAIADAKISISGKGVIADKQSPGFGHRAFDFLWPY